MKKLFLSSIIFILIVFACSCSNQSSDTQNTSSEENNTEDFIVDKLIYESGNIALNCTKIVSDGIEFEVTNKTKSEISPMFSVSLDNILIDTNSSGDWSIQPNETKTCKLNLNFPQFKNTEHKSMSLCGHIFQENVSIEFINAYNVDLGGDEHIEDIPQKNNELYSDEYIDLYYVDAVTDGLRYIVKNNTTNPITVGIDTLLINGETEISPSLMDVPTKSEGAYIANDYPTTFSQDIKGFKGNLIVYDAEYTQNIEEIQIEYGDNQLSTEGAYNIATSLTKYDLTEEDNYYLYNDIPLLKDDCEWINSSWNTEGTVNQGAIYRKMAYLLEGLKYNDYTDYAEYIIGYIPQTKDDFTPYAENAKNFITINDSVQNIMKKFESLSVVNGEFDYEANTIGNYNITISNLSKCAKEMQISEEMLGYIIAFLNEYTDDITFDNNTCTIVL